MFPNTPGWSGLILSACTQNTKAHLAKKVRPYTTMCAPLSIFSVALCYAFRPIKPTRHQMNHPTTGNPSHSFLQEPL
jgi:hypothetical protein